MTHDPSNMLGHINALPDQLDDAWHAGQELSIPAADFSSITIVGMGGSAISGDLAAALLADSAPVPIQTVRGYDLPAYIGENALVIAISFSGGTEETLSCAEQAIERGAQVIALTTGGHLGPMVEAAGGSVAPINYDSPPRAALGWLYGTLLAVFGQLGLLPDDFAADMQEAVDALRADMPTLQPDVDDAENRAKRTARQLMDRLPVIWGAGLMGPVAARWKTQLNENAKTAAYAEELPELNHNAVVGIEYPESVLMGKFFPIQLCSIYDHPRVAIRHEATKELLMGAGIVVDTFTARGKSQLTQQMNLIQLGDYISYYLAMAYEVDPTRIDPIIALKQRLADV